MSPYPHTTLTWPGFRCRSGDGDGAEQLHSQVHVHRPRPPTVTVLVVGGGWRSSDAQTITRRDSLRRALAVSSCLFNNLQCPPPALLPLSLPSIKNPPARSLLIHNHQQPDPTTPLTSRISHIAYLNRRIQPSPLQPSPLRRLPQVPGTSSCLCPSRILRLSVSFQPRIPLTHTLPHLHANRAILFWSSKRFIVYVP